MKNKYLSIFLILLGILFDCQAKREPSWMKELPLPSNNTYIFVRESGEGKTIGEAMNMALVRVFQNTASRLGQPFNEEETYAALHKGTDYVTVSKQINIPINKVDQYVVNLKNGSYWVCVLCQVASMRDVTPVWDKGERAKNDDDFASMFKSLLPGLGQMGKGYYGEGVVTLLGEVVLIGSGVGCYFLAQNQLDIMNNTRNNDNTAFLTAKKNYNNLRTTQYAVWGVAGALYVINLIRAYTLTPKSDTFLALEPSVISTPDALAPGIGLTLNF